MCDGIEAGEKGSRRYFLKSLIIVFNAVSAAALAVPGLGYLLTPVFRTGDGSWVSLGSKNKYQSTTPQKSEFTYISESGYTRKERQGFVWICRDAAQQNVFTVFSPVCSHTGCNVAWQDAREVFVCPCHNGTYDSEGKVISGPPPKPLKKLPVKIENDQVYIQLAAGA
ncbi:MAG: ubiquinol-cytochrome c reductase iron-sulfur subunit [bacterium]